jgi:hypothetical protein
METFGPLLADDRTLLYLCGIAGMEAGVFGVHGPATGWAKSYFTRKEQALGRLRTAQTAHRCCIRRCAPPRAVMLEVY